MVGFLHIGLALGFGIQRTLQLHLVLAKKRSHVLSGTVMASQETKATFPVWRLNTWLLNEGGALCGSGTNPAAQHASSPVSDRVFSFVHSK